MPETAPAITREIAPLAVDQDSAAALLSVSRSTFDRMAEDGRLGPEPVRLSARCLRYSRIEIEQWVAAGMPPRPKWLAMKQTTPAA